MDKLIQLQNLARKRQKTIREGYKNIGDFHNGIYECDFVSPYTKSACNLDAGVMLILQDWVGVDKLSGPIIQDAIDLGHIPSLPTNKRLKELLERHFQLSLSDTYATNLFPLIKHGNLSANIPLKDMVWAAQQFGIPQIEIVQPDTVVCLGLRTFNALRKSVGLRSCPTIGIAIESVFTIGKSKIFCQAHTGTLGQIGRGYEQVELDWRSMCDFNRKKNQQEFPMNIHEKLNYVEFAAHDLPATKTFFSAVFGWEFVDYGPEYTAFSNQGLDGGFYKADLRNKSESGGALLVFYSENIQATLKKVTDNNGTIIRPVFEFPGGFRFHFTEPSGNEFAVWSEIK